MTDEASDELPIFADQNVLDDANEDTSVAPVQYDISSYGADYDVEGLVRRMAKKEIFIPAFQRQYVWKEKEASRFVESLLLGLPVPGIFLAKEVETNRMLVIDGQQRLRTLEFFYTGFFKPSPTDDKKKVFKLVEVQKRFLGLTYATLHENDRRRLDNSIIHATVLKQEAPKDDDTSIYHVFERLNTGGQKLTQQEIRVSIYYGSLFDAIRTMNENATWRKIFGKKSIRMKDEELILRFLALFYWSDKYEKPFAEFLTRFAIRFRKADAAMLSRAEQTFVQTVECLSEVGPNVFRPEGTLNAAVFDATMVGVARRLANGPVRDYERLAKVYAELMKDKEFLAAVTRATSDESSVSTRLAKATSAFVQVP